MKRWQANCLAVALYALIVLVAWLEFCALRALGLLPLPEPLAFLALVLFGVQLWLAYRLAVRIPAVRRFLDRPVIHPDDK